VLLTTTDLFLGFDDDFFGSFISDDTTVMPIFLFLQLHQLFHKQSKLGYDFFLDSLFVKN
jgi:hypothetical protein